MPRFTCTSLLLISAFLAQILHAGAAPIALLDRRAVTQTANNFKELAYADFQISDGVAGNAQAEANAVFVDPFAGTDLSTVSGAVQNAIEAMRQAAESAETEDFNPAIDAASGSGQDALQVGKIKNKVLKLKGEVQVLNIKIAKAKSSGDDTSDLESKLTEEQTKLDKNVATDKASAGAPSKGVVDSSSTPDTATTETAVAVSQTAVDFKELDYPDFQISDTVAGNAATEANAVFVDPFANVDLSTVSSDVLDAMNSMREAAESAETEQFNPEIDAATGAAKDALQVGKIKNKVLKLTGEVQVLNIKIAQAQANGDDTSDLESKLKEEQTKLSTNIATDKKNVGKTSKGVA